MRAAPPNLVLRPLGDAALTAELGSAIDPELSAEVRALDRALLDRPFSGLVETVPTHRSLLVCFDPARCSFGDAAEAVTAAAERAVVSEQDGRLHEIPVRYGHEDGPDLADVARRVGITPAELVAFHSGREYTAFMLGFLPGFAYLGLLPESLETPRLETPRPRVPAGSVGIAGRLTGVYPAASPGGWNLLGRTSLRLFDPRQDPPSLISPGDRVRFRSVTALEEPAPTAATLLAPAHPALQIESPGLLTLVQAAPRRGYRRYGVAGGGPLDATALASANRAVGNPEDAPGLECTVAGPTLRFLRPVSFAVAGADLGARLERSDLGGAWPVPPSAKVLARTGNVLTFEGRASGCRAYIAFAGGLDILDVLGSASTDRLGGFGGFSGRALSAGDVLGLRALDPAFAPDPRRAPSLASSNTSPAGDEATVRVIFGPQDDAFMPEARDALLSATFEVLPVSDRVGLRLAGPRLAHKGSAEIVSDGMVPGSIQVPPDGKPIVMLADGPTTGGYAKIATVLSADLSRLAQLLPGAGRVRFTQA